MASTSTDSFDAFTELNHSAFSGVYSEADNPFAFPTSFEDEGALDSPLELHETTKMARSRSQPILSDRLKRRSQRENSLTFMSEHYKSATKSSKSDLTVTTANMSEAEDPFCCGEIPMTSIKSAFHDSGFVTFEASETQGSFAEFYDDDNERDIENFACFDQPEDSQDQATTAPTKRIVLDKDGFPVSKSDESSKSLRRSTRDDHEGSRKGDSSHKSTSDKLRKKSLDHKKANSRNENDKSSSNHRSSSSSKKLSGKDSRGSSRMSELGEKSSHHSIKSTPSRSRESSMRSSSDHTERHSRTSSTTKPSDKDLGVSSERGSRSRHNVTRKHFDLRGLENNPAVAAAIAAGGSSHVSVRLVTRRSGPSRPSPKESCSSAPDVSPKKDFRGKATATVENERLKMYASTSERSLDEVLQKKTYDPKRQLERQASNDTAEAVVLDQLSVGRRRYGSQRIKEDSEKFCLRSQEHTSEHDTDPTTMRSEKRQPSLDNDTPKRDQRGCLLASIGGTGINTTQHSGHFLSSECSAVIVDCAPRPPRRTSN